MICALPGNEAFAARLREELGAPALGLEYRRFPDGEAYVRFTEDVHGRDVILVCTLNDPDSKTLALLFAARNAEELGARSVGLVAPYLAYMRQDQRFRSGEAITSVHFAKLIGEAFDWLVTVDPHLHRRRSLAEVYSIPSAVVAAAPAIAHWIRENVSKPLVLGPDSESEQWAAEVARGCGAPFAVMSKTRLGDRDVRIGVPPLAEWKGRSPVLIDDIISSARTMALAARMVREAGFPAPVCVGVHAVLASGALQSLRESGVSLVATTNTIAHATNAIDVAALVAAALKTLSARTP